MDAGGDTSTRLRSVLSCEALAAGGRLRGLVASARARSQQRPSRRPAARSRATRRPVRLVAEEWRRARDSNPQGPRGPVDFKSTALPVEASPPCAATTDTYDTPARGPLGRDAASTRLSSLAFEEGGARSSRPALWLDPQPSSS